MKTAILFLWLETHHQAERKKYKVLLINIIQVKVLVNLISFLELATVNIVHVHWTPDKHICKIINGKLWERILKWQVVQESLFRLYIDILAKLIGTVLINYFNK